MNAAAAAIATAFLVNIVVSLVSFVVIRQARPNGRPAQSSSQRRRHDNTFGISLKHRLSATAFSEWARKNMKPGALS
ncbi:MAG TPA: hypothetical protein VJ484_06445, partial [Lysobacter sp.]|nr:hypothetical protein [Lysobacter sp.]